MTSRSDIERLLNMTGRTLEVIPERHSVEEWDKWVRTPGISLEQLCHQSDVIELLVGALRDSEPKRVYGNCHHCKNGTYSYPITQMDRTLIRHANFCNECGRDLRHVVREMHKREK